MIVGEIERLTAQLQARLPRLESSPLEGLGRADRAAADYLRAAQAYMLISMPTGTSTIFGAFQVIQNLPGILARQSRNQK
jgi:hypothetical protein